MSHTFVYLFTRLDSLHNILFFCLFIILSGIILYTIQDLVENDSFNLKKIKLPIIICSSLGLLLMLLPTQKEAAVIYLLPKIVNNEQIQDMSKKSLDIIEMLTEEYLRELKDDIGLKKEK